MPALIGPGKSCTALDPYNRAQNALFRARELNRRNPEAQNQPGNLALQEMNPTGAIEHFDEALRLDRSNLSALTGKAVSLDYLSRDAEAQETPKPRCRAALITRLWRESEGLGSPF